MSELDTLRPEVREAFLYLDRFENCPSGWTTIRAELLRLANENLEFRKDMADVMMAIGGSDTRLVVGQSPSIQYTAAVSLRHRADKAEAELAALRARIADAPVATLVLASSAGDLMLIWAENPDEWVDKDVRLLVDEPPAERGEG